MQPAIQNILIIILPFLGLTLPGVLKQDKYQPWVNSVIVGLIVVLASVTTAYTKDQFGPNFFVDAGVVLAGISALLAGPLRNLDAFLQGNVFTLVQKELPLIIPSLASLNASTSSSVPLSVASSALIHITANTVHIPTTAPVATPTVVSTAPTPVVPIEEHIDASVPVAGDVVPDVVPVATGIATPEDASQETLKIAAVKPTTQLAV